MLAPNFTLPYLNQEGRFTLSEDIGKIIILTFWASWCPDCSVDLPKKEKLYQSLDHKEVKLLTVNVTGRERNDNAAMQFTTKFLTQPTLADNGTEIYDLYKCKGVPTTVLIDKKGNLHKQFGDQADFMEIVASLGELLR